MTNKEYRAFMLDTARTAKCATVRPDGMPHVAPIWFAMDGDNLMFTTWHESVKAANIQHNPHVAICVDDEHPPFSFVIVEGEAEILDPTPEERIAWAGRIAGRYMGADQAEAFGKRNGVPGELLIRVKPTKIIANKNLSD
ncbi:MAG: PPOX class F420-dependent oxidoreductase [Anaerolineae bacterium]|nr:PPOX class F420-dependent oxidoreductase [Anaerolineae bacterium]